MSQPEGTAASPPRARKCPICGRPAQPDTQPFCSKRCADVDLHRWLSDSYRIPGPEDESGDRDSERDPGA